MVCRRPGIMSSDIKRQTHGFAESTFVVFENLRARKMSHDFPIRGSGSASFAHYAFRSGTSNRVSHHRAHIETRTPLSGSCPGEIAVRRRRRRESAVEGQGTASYLQRGKAHCVALQFYG